MKQLMLPFVGSELHAEDILYSHAALVPSLRYQLLEQLRAFGLREDYDVKQPGDKVATISQSMDWLRQYTTENRLDIIRRAIQVCVAELAQKIVHTTPFKNRVTLLSSLNTAVERGDTRDKITLTIEILDA